MSKDSYYQSSVFQARMPRIAQRRQARGLTLGALFAVAALAGCGPDGGGSGASETPAATAASAASAASSGPNAADSASAALAGSTASAARDQAAAPLPPPAACPKVTAPRCPSPAPAATAAGAEHAPNPLAATWSGAAQRLWSHRREAHHHAGYADRRRRDWDLGRPWPGDQSRRDRPDYDHAGRGELRGDLASSRQYSERFAHLGVSEGEQTRIESRETERSESWRASSGEHLIERQGDGGVLRPCPDHCRGIGHRTFGYAGIDERGYLVWPGKVEY